MDEIEAEQSIEVLHGRPTICDTIRVAIVECKTTSCCANVVKQRQGFLSQWKLIILAVMPPSPEAETALSTNSLHLKKQCQGLHPLTFR